MLWVVIAQIIFTYLRAVNTVNYIFDYIPRAISYTITYSIAIGDQLSGCFFTNIFYNRLAWSAGWFAFSGLIHPPLYFCVDERMLGPKNWEGAPTHCPNPSWHDQILNCMCKSDLDCKEQSCIDYCDKETNQLNILRLFSDVDLCLSFGHFMFASLLFAIIFQAVHKLQKQAIIHGTVFYGLYLWTNYGDSKSAGFLTVISDFTGVAFATSMSYPVLVEFQNKVSCRITRSIGLDLSPPDSIPLSLSEAWSVLVSSWRTILLSIVEGASIAISVYMFRYSLHSQFKIIPEPNGFCDNK